VTFPLANRAEGLAGTVSDLVYKELGRFFKITDTITLRIEPKMSLANDDTTHSFAFIDNHFIALQLNRIQWLLNADLQFKGM
jgi:hypothetical protein